MRGTPTMLNLRKGSKPINKDFTFTNSEDFTLSMVRVGQRAGEWNREVSKQNTLYIKCTEEVAKRLLTLELMPTGNANMINISQEDIVEAYNKMYK